MTDFETVDFFRDDRLVAQVALNVRRQVVGCVITTAAILLQRLHHNPIKVTTQQCAEPAWLRVTVPGHDGEVGSQQGA